MLYATAYDLIFYSQDKSVKPGFELQAIDVAHLPENQPNLIHPLQSFRVILIYIIAQFSLPCNPLSSRQMDGLRALDKFGEKRLDRFSEIHPPLVSSEASLHLTRR